MKASIDPDLCTGCEVCVDTCPDVFEMEDDLAVVKVDVVPADAEDPKIPGILNASWFKFFSEAQINIIGNWCFDHIRKKAPFHHFDLALSGLISRIVRTG